MSKRKVVSRTTYVDESKIGRRASPETSSISTGQVEAWWLCNSCNSPYRIPGRIKKCPNCGNPKDQSETYMPPGMDAPLLSADQLAAMGVDKDHSSDQQCAFCGYFSPPGTADCPWCGANLEDVARTSRKCPNCSLETNLVTCPDCGAKTEPKGVEEAHSFFPSIQLPTGVGFDPSSLMRFWWIPVVILAIAGLFWWLIPRTAPVVVQDVQWTCTIPLQEYQYNAHEGWDTPVGAENISSETRIHHYDQVLDHYENVCHYEQQLDGYDTETYSESVCESVYSYTSQTCYNDGTCDSEDHYTTECHDETRTREVPRYKDVQVCVDEPRYRDEPVYQTYYFYQIWEWVFISPAVTSGHDLNPIWPSDYLVDDRHRALTDLGTMDLGVIFVTEDNEKSFNYTPSSLQEFQTFLIGSTWSITYSGSSIIEIEPR